MRFFSIKAKYISASFLSLCLLGCSTAFKSVNNLSLAVSSVARAPYQTQLDILSLINRNYLSTTDLQNWNENVQPWWGHGDGGESQKLSKRNGFALTALYNYFYYSVGLKDYGMLDLKKFAADLGLPTNRSDGSEECKTPDGEISFCNTNPDPNIPGDTNYNPNWGDIKSTIPFVDLTGNSDFLAWAFANPAHWDGIDMILGYVIAICTGINLLPQKFQDAGLNPSGTPIFSHNLFPSNIYSNGIIYSIMAGVFGCSFVGKANVYGFSNAKKSSLRAFWGTFYGNQDGGFGPNGDAINDPTKNFLFAKAKIDVGKYNAYNDYGVILMYYINTFAHAYNESIKIDFLSQIKNPNAYEFIKKCSHYGTDDFGTIGTAGSSGKGFATNPLNFWELGWSYDKGITISDLSNYAYDSLGYGAYNHLNWQSPLTYNNILADWDIDSYAYNDLSLAVCWGTAENVCGWSAIYYQQSASIHPWLGDVGKTLGWNKVWNPWHKVNGSIDFFAKSNDSYGDATAEPLIVVDYPDNRLNESNNYGPGTVWKSKNINILTVSNLPIVSDISTGWGTLIRNLKPWKNSKSLWDFTFNFITDYPKENVVSYSNYITIWNNLNNNIFLQKLDDEIQKLKAQIKSSDLGFHTKTPFPDVDDAFKNARPNNLDNISTTVSSEIDQASQAQKAALVARHSEIENKYNDGNLGYNVADGVKHFIDENDILHLKNKAECDTFEEEGGKLDLFINEQKALLSDAQTLLAQKFNTADLGYSGSWKKYTLADIQAQTHNKSEILSLESSKYGGYEQEQQTMHAQNYQRVQNLYSSYDKGYSSQYALKELSFYKNKSQLDEAGSLDSGKQLDNFRLDEIASHKNYQSELSTAVQNDYLFYDENPSGVPMLTFKEINNLIENATDKKALDIIKGNQLVTFKSDQISSWNIDLDKLKHQFNHCDLGYGTPLPDFEKVFSDKYKIDAARVAGGALINYKDSEINLRNKDANNLEQEYNLNNLFYSQFLNGNPTVPQPDWNQVMANDGGWTKDQITDNRINNLPAYKHDQNKALSEDLVKLKQEYQNYNLGYGTAGLPDFNNMVNKHNIDTARSNIDVFKTNQTNARNKDVDDLKTEFSNASRGYIEHLDGTRLHFQVPDFNKLKDNDPTVGAHKNDVDNYRDNVLPNYEKEQIEIRNNDANNLKREYSQKSNGYDKKLNGKTLDNPLPDFAWITAANGGFGGTKTQIDYWKQHLNAFHEEQEEIYSEDVAVKDPAIVRINEVIAYLNNTILFPNPSNYHDQINTINKIAVNLGMPSNIIMFLKQNYGYLHYLKQTGMKNNVRYLLFAEYGIYFIADHNTTTDTWSYMFYDQALGQTLTYKATALSFSIVKDKDDPDSHSLQINGAFTDSFGKKHTLTLTFNYPRPTESQKYPTPIISSQYPVVDMKLISGSDTTEFYASISKSFGQQFVIETSGTYSVNDPNNDTVSESTPKTNYFWHVYITTSGEWIVGVNIQYKYSSTSDDPSKATYTGGKIIMLNYKSLENGKFSSMNADNIASNLPDAPKPTPPTSLPKWLAGAIAGAIIGMLFIPTTVFMILRMIRRKDYLSHDKLPKPTVNKKLSPQENEEHYTEYRDHNNSQTKK